MGAISDETTPKPLPDNWEAIFAEVNSWRGACMHHFSMVETAVTETLLALSAAAPEKTTIRLRHLIGQRFEDLTGAIGSDGPFEDAGKHTLPELARFRENHEAFRTLICHGTVKVTVEPNGRWLLLIRTLSIRSRQPERTMLAMDQSEAEAKLAAIKRDGTKLASLLGQFRKAVAKA